ncbi:related to nucleoporin [Cephalotrichum gorgonifer]|uniref:Related to nucleoporin n=1 Tax=Cephalotrichum gorgonifer TaxID=2041049 RepID=A0AAE8SVN1_9PEZI|nr:related to nucleoporin [Cephalotrichum gorgonifer]
MADQTTLAALQDFDRSLLAVLEGRCDDVDLGEDEALLAVFQTELNKLWTRPPRRSESRSAVNAGKIEINGDEYSINDEFKQIVLNLSDEIEVDEIEAAAIVLASQNDPALLGRSLLECAIIRLHQHRKYVLNIIRILIDLAGDEERENPRPSELAQKILEVVVFATKDTQRIVPRCMAAMKDVRAWIQKLNDKITAVAVMSGGQPSGASEELETVEFSRVSLIQQHELMGVILCRAIEDQPQVDDFKALLVELKAADKYDSLLVHRIPPLASFITKLGSPESKDEERSRQFLDSLRDGAFDFMLSVAADVKSVEWQDPARMGMRTWLQRKSPNLPADSVPSSETFQTTLMGQLEDFVDAFITNLPNVLRKLRVDEDEQRQMSQTHEHDLNLERFLIIIAYSYEGRPLAGANFWSDEESNLAGFMTWASRRASTPLVTAFCEMLQAISENEDCATSAHHFLLDEGTHGSGKLRRSLSLTWSQIFKELAFFSEKIREKPAPVPTTFRPGKPNPAQAEAEPESAMMLECYLRLMTKLATESEAARLYLLREAKVDLIDILFQLAGSQIPPRLRACTFWALGALLSRKTTEDCHLMWTSLDNWTTGYYSSQASHTSGYPKLTHAPTVSPERVLEEISNGFEEPYAFILLLTSLVTPVEGSSPLSDSLPFPENLGSSYRMPGIDSFVDYVIGDVLSKKTRELTEVNQARMLRLQCLEFAVVCLESFNENLIILANSTNLPIDAAMSTTDLSTYVRMHPFARVMEWMLTEKAVAAVFSAIHQPAVEVGNAAPDSPLILGILRGITLISRILDLQPTYLDIIRPIIRNQSNYSRLPGSTSRYSSFEDGLVGHLDLVVDLGTFCGLGHPDLSLACLKLLERVSVSSRITSAWSANIGPRTHRNKAIVALEANGDHEAIARSLMSDLMAPLDTGREMDSPVYMIKIYILDFLYACLRESPRRPSIGHLLLGFQCEVDRVSVEPGSPFFKGTSVFHSLINLWSSTHAQDGQGVRQWLVALEQKVLRILQILWSSPLTAPIVIDELRNVDFVFALLAKEDPILPGTLWEGQEMATLEFPLTEGAIALTEFLSHRAALFNYIAIELCGVSQARSPTYKRRIFEALRGTVVIDSQESITVSTIFELFDFILPTSDWQLAEPVFQFYGDLDLSICVDEDADGNRIYNIERVKEILLVKRSESRGSAQVISPQELASIDREEAIIIEYLVSSNRQIQIVAQCHKLLKSWVNLVLIMIESNDFQGSARTSFYLETLQTILPSLEVCSSERQQLAYELAKLAKVLLFKLDLTVPASAEGVNGKGAEMSHLVGDKLYQLFQICLQGIGKWADQSELRSIYYSICYRYLTGMVDKDSGVLGRQKTMRTIQIYGDRLANVICDDAYGGEPGCQTAALILLSALVNLGNQEADSHIVDTLNRLNFIGVMVDSLKNMMQESAEMQRGQQEHYLDAKLALLLQLCQTREGAKYVLHANLFRAIELSGLFSVDPELQIDPSSPAAMATHYALLAKVSCIISAALVSRASHNTAQGRRFLTDHRMLVAHTLKRSAGIGHVDDGLSESVAELADSFIVMITATGFLEFENEVLPEPKRGPEVMFH